MFVSFVLKEEVAGGGWVEGLSLSFPFFCSRFEVDVSVVGPFALPSEPEERPKGLGVNR